MLLGMVYINLNSTEVLTCPIRVTYYVEVGRTWSASRLRLKLFLVKFETESELPVVHKAASFSFQVTLTRHVRDPGIVLLVIRMFFSLSEIHWCVCEEQTKYEG